MQRGSDKTGPRRDDERKHEVSGLTTGGHEPRAEEWREQEPWGEDQPEADMAPDVDLAGGTPPGMSQRDVKVRSDLAKYLGRGVYPADRAGLLRQLEEASAPDELVELVRGLPQDGQYANVQQVSERLGIHTEDHRF